MIINAEIKKNKSSRLVKQSNTCLLQHPTRAIIIFQARHKLIIARFCKQDNLLTQSHRPRALSHEGVCGASVRLSTELSFPRSVPFLKWSEKEDVLLVLLHKIFKQKKKQASSLDRSLLNSKRECDTLYASFNDILSLPPPSAYEVRPRVPIQLDRLRLW